MKNIILCIYLFYLKLFRIQKCYTSASNDFKEKIYLQHPDETAEKKSILHNIQTVQEDSIVKNKNNSSLNTKDSKQIKISDYRKSVIGSFSQSSSIFHGLGVGLQCVPNSIISLVYNKYKSCSFWIPQDLDQILKMGNILYNSIGKQTTLLVSEIP